MFANIAVTTTIWSTTLSIAKNTEDHLFAGGDHDKLP
jgi:hypothetical protein